MTWLDWTLVAVVLLAFLQGVRRGPIVGVLGLASLLAAYVAAAAWYSALADPLTMSLHLDKAWAGTVAFLVLLFVISLVLGVIFQLLLVGAQLSGPVRLLGGIVGIVRGAVFGTLVLVVSMASPQGPTLRSDVDHSKLAPPAIRGYKVVLKAIMPVLPAKIRLPDAETTRF